MFDTSYYSSLPNYGRLKRAPTTSTMLAIVRSISHNKCVLRITVSGQLIWKYF